MTPQLPYATLKQVFARFAEIEPEPKGELEHVNAFTLLVAVALSAQATDVGVNKATRKLFQIADTPEKMLALGEEALIEHIKTIGLFRNKAKNVIKLSRLLIDNFGGEVPSSRAALVTLPGVGRKTANVVLSMWFHHPAQAVDTHIFRVGNRTGICPGRDETAVERAHRGQRARRIPAPRPPLAYPAWPVYLRRAQTQMRHLPDPGLVPYEEKTA